MSLYQKYRPSSLDEVKGNVEILETLKTMLSKPESCPHAFLLTGPTGCGKTTLGRIIANELGASEDDYKEVDSASFRGIDTIRELKSNSSFKPLKGNVRVWLIDECHKLTNDAQNAILKLLEDPPQHVYFILCTTDPQKLLPTIKGRCQTFQVSQLNETQLTGLLRRVVRGEQETVEKEIYEHIVTNSQGHPRNALQILEQVLNSPSEQRLAIAKKATVEAAQSIDLCRLLIKGAQWKEVTIVLNGLQEQEAEEIRRHILGYCQSILLKEKNDKAAAIIETFYEPLYNIGFPGLVYCCYSILNN